MTALSSASTHSTMPPLELTLIVAATRSMGIGLAGTLPWTGLKQEMAYFARVTKRLPPAMSQGSNAVIMGRKTWESIPTKFRPLKGRTNVVISRSSPALPSNAVELQMDEKAYKVPTIADAVNVLRAKKEVLAGEEAIGRSFIIGGAEIYKLALGLKEAKRVLLTRVLGEFECDTWFPVKLSEEGGESGWVKRSKEELDAWVGEAVPEGVQVENGTEYVFEMWEKE